ncbi:MAG: hypothetical protein IPP51_05260 [Bacteroidetes bacterium]|nr:hypothetical protein [Bacteroidota bacterium]
MATYLGSNTEDQGYSIISNSHGDIYVAGYTSAVRGFPNCGVPISNNGFPSCYSASEYTQQTGNGPLNAIDEFISRFNSDGVLVWSSLFGGYGSDGFTPQLAIDSRDNVYLVSSTTSPTTSSQNGIYTHQPFNGIYYEGAALGNYGGQDGYIVCFNPQNVPIWSTYFGGNSEDIIYGVAVGNIASPAAEYLYICGSTTSNSNTFPVNIDLLNQCCSDFYVGLTDAFVGQFDIGSLDGVDEMSQNDEFLDLYPNPASEYVTLILDAKSCGEFEICLIDIFWVCLLKRKI